MQRKYRFIGMIAVGVLLTLTAAIWLASAPPAKAQCGSQASSCKNCHEVQGEMSVNSDGTSWHQAHAFGDFCYICHAGNNQATDKAEAHTGMVPPLSDIKASCQQCHPADLEERAQVYATTLGVEVGAGGSGGTANSPASDAGTVAPISQAVSAPQTTELDVNDPNLIDYVKNYNEIVLGQTPTNWGNIILILFIIALLVVGGGFVLRNEDFVKVTFGDMKKPDGDYPADVVDMLPTLSGLKSNSRKSLKNILGNTDKTEKVLGLIDAVVSEDEE